MHMNELKLDWNAIVPALPAELQELIMEHLQRALVASLNPKAPAATSHKARRGNGTVAVHNRDNLRIWNTSPEHDGKPLTVKGRQFRINTGHHNSPRQVASKVFKLWELLAKEGTTVSCERLRALAKGLGMMDGITVAQLYERGLIDILKPPVTPGPQIAQAVNKALRESR
jgi:hypothetical protein